MRSIVLLTVLLAVAFAAIIPDRHPLYERVKAPNDWLIVGAPAKDKMHKLTIALPAKNQHILIARFNEISDPDHKNYRKFMTTEEVAALVDPGMEVKGPVLDWLSSEPNVKIFTHGEFIKVEAPIAAIENLFQTKMATYMHVQIRKNLYRNIGNSSIPKHLRDVVLMVEGLHEFPALPHTASKSKRSALQLEDAAESFGNNSMTAYSVNFPLSIWALYNIPNNTAVTNPNATQGCFAQYAADGICQPADLNRFDLLNNIAPQTYIYNGENDTTLGGEASLDIQMLTSVAINASTTFFMQQAWMYTFSTDLISMGAQAPLVISVSYGWNEDQECNDVLHDLKVCSSHGWSTVQYINNTDLQFVKLGATGHTMLVSSGDQGAPGDENTDCSKDGALALYPQYPASSPYVVSVGASAVAGTKPASIGPVPHRGALKQPCMAPLLNCTRGPGPIIEVPCYLQNADFTTGGGFSQVLAQPDWQQAAVQHYLKSSVNLPPASKFNASNRGYPDLAAVGQNIMTVQNANWFITGGTSASAPITAGIMTLLNNWLLNNKKAPLGFVNPLLYKMAAAQPSTFNKITWGSNRCTEDACCKYGFDVPSDGSWNPVTGLGTPNFQQMLQYIQQNL